MKKPQGLDLAVIGNCRTAALLDTNARLVWWCFPRFDGDPVFSRLLTDDEEKGFCDVVLDGCAESESRYIANTAVVETILRASDGAAIKITDFAPRFRNFGRMFRPPQLVRVIEPVAGMPRITIRCRPTKNYGETIDRRSLGSSHIRYEGTMEATRLTTDASVALIDREAAFVLQHAVHVFIGNDEPVIGEINQTAREFLDHTLDYWREWVRRLSIGYEWQEAVIRAAITLKLSSFEETGAIVAALTTSIPEAEGSHRNWDYRFCWLRDAHYVVKALNRIGATRTMEGFINFTLGIAHEEKTDLKPCYGIVPNSSLEEVIAPHLKGYDGAGMVRVGNAAAVQVQNDSYGGVIMAALPMFYDRRLPRPGDENLFHLLERLGSRAADLALTPDAGIWEYRGKSRIHSNSAAMCWAGVSRLGAIATHLGLSDRAQHWNKIADTLQAEILEKSWSEKKQAFTAAFGSDDLDASALLLPEIGLVDANDPRFVSTVTAIERELIRNGHVMRYAAADDFGFPETAFLICHFWLIDAYALLGRRDEARAMFEQALGFRNHYGLLSEDVHPVTGALWGNFPQTYSMAGLISSAMRLSRSWEDRYWRASS
ncbi:MAG TPA: glycoside hydrolase family 15 protein [Rhizomicrobium sp.]|jgi:GH15 family glucan-1,4-alpha-glucosidase